MHGYGQDSSWRKVMLDSLKPFISSPLSDATLTNLEKFDLDSALKAKLKNAIDVDTSDLIKSIKLPSLQVPSFEKKKLISFNGGYVSYYWNYRSSIDTPFQESDISQHLLTARANITLNETFPFVVTYFERQTNSKYFRDYRDIRVEFNPIEFQKIQFGKFEDYLKKTTEQLRNPFLKPSLDYYNKKLITINDWLDDTKIIDKLIDSRLKVHHKKHLDSTSLVNDTTYINAKNFVQFYDQIKENSKKLEVFKDSLQREYVKSEKIIQTIRKIPATKLSEKEKVQHIEEVLRKAGVDSAPLKKIYRTISAIKTFAVGRVQPNYSELTLRRINVNGINVEYNRGVYLAFSAGAVDFRARDFLYSKQKRAPQFVYAARIGWGAREGNHLYLTAFKGKKQLLSSSINPPALTIYGISFEGQFEIYKHHRLIAEVAQSTSQGLITTTGQSDKPSFNFNDKHNKAYSLKLNSFLPSTRSRIEAFYSHRGINYQSFANFFTNAASVRWYFKADQYFLKRKLQIKASVEKNTYENPFFLTRYSGNTVFKNISATFRSYKLPSVTVGYIPSSQLAEIDGQIYENYYQSFNVNVHHQYNLGLAKSFSIFNYNRFFNDSRDSGFLYFNARNYYFNQNIHFLTHTANISIAQTKNSQHALTTLEAGLNTKVLKRNLIGIGVKINRLNSNSVKVGLYGNQKFIIPKVGELNIWIEKAYLPGFSGDLIKNEFYNIGFTRFFK